MDFIMGLPLVHGYTFILVVIERLSKYAHHIPWITHFMSALVVEKFIQHVKLHGVGKTIVSNRDKTFTNKFFAVIVQKTGHHFSHEYDIPSVDG